MSSVLPGLTLSGPPSAPPESWALARGAALRVARPLGRFMHVQASSGIVLMAAAALALVWANSRWGDAYVHLWHTPVGLRIGSFAFEHPLHFWVNDVAMVVFFFVVGLEIRREIHEGELSEVRRAALPLFAALGGMAAPAAIYWTVAGGTAVSHGWAVPTATDIAFAVGVFALLGKRVPAALRVLLLALAIIDDIGAIVIIALFYSSGVAFSGLAVACAGVLGVLALQRVGVRRPLVYVLPGFVVWMGMLQSGVHPTIAGVVVGLLTPARPWYGERGFLAVTSRSLEAIRSGGGAALGEQLHRIDAAQREAQAPVVRLTDALHPWVAFGIMPIFALANAGVRLDGIELRGDSSLIGLGVVAGLVLGKPLGILGVSWVAVRLGVCSLPRGVSWTGVFVLALAAGIGFTMAIFVAGLAFVLPANLAAAKLAVLCASAIAGVAALLGGFLLLPASSVADVAHVTVDDAERSTEY